MIFAVRSEQPPVLSDTDRRELKAELEKELCLPASDIRSSAWFHGTIPRETAEKLVINNGDFLVRESLSQPGLYLDLFGFDQQCVPY